MAARPLSPPPLSLLHSTVRCSKHGPSRFCTFSFPSTPHHLPTKTASPHSYSSFSSFYRHQQKPRHEGGGEEQQHVDDEEHAIGDCLVFEEGAFEGGVIEEDGLPPPPAPARRKPQAVAEEVKAESLVPERWKEAVAEINMTKKEKRVIARELRFGSKVERRRRMPPPGSDLAEYRMYREMKLSQLKPVELDDPVEPPPPPRPPSPPGEDGGLGSGGRRTSERVAPRNPRLEVAGEGFEAINEFFSSGDYVPGAVNDDKKPKGSRKLFTKEEKVLLNRRIPSLAEATSRKWLPLHTLAASGEFYLLDALLKHDVDINAVDTDGLSAIHKAVLGKKQAILNYLLRESVNPFVRDNDGATLIHYAVQTASSPAIKILILYNVDINLSDNDGWTPLHLAVQTQRTDIVKLLLIKGADKSLKNKDGLTPLDLCLYSGRSARTFELIKLFKELPTSKLLS